MTKLTKEDLRTKTLFDDLRRSVKDLTYHNIDEESAMLFANSIIMGRLNKNESEKSH